MGNNQSVITINNSQYDAKTGKVVSTSARKIFMQTRKIETSQRYQASEKPKNMSQRMRATTQSQQLHVTAQKSKTLMRNALKNPANIKNNDETPTAKKGIQDAHKNKKSSTNILHQDTAKKSTALLLNHSGRQMDIISTTRNTVQTKKHPLVKKFADASTTESATNAVVPQAARLDPVAPQVTIKAHSHQQLSPMPVQSRAGLLIDKSLQNATSHTQKHHTVAKKNRFFLSSFRKLSTVAASFVLLAGFFTYQNIASLSVRYASSRSGVTANLPGYRPSGFTLSRTVNYGPGKVTISFVSNSDDRNFVIDQQKSDWNSQSLLSNYSELASNAVQTYENGGKTIYLYGDSNATWIDRGIWYDIKGNSRLTSDQLLKIANSI